MYSSVVIFIAGNDCLVLSTALFDEHIVRHQVKYLGLMENLRVGRAGFCYRRQFDIFLNRLVCVFVYTAMLTESGLDTCLS